MKSKLRIFKRKIIMYISSSFLKIYGCFHKIEKKILFDSFSGKQYSDNPRAISEKMHQLYPDYKIVWWINKKIYIENFVPDYVDIISGKKEFIKNLSTCVAYITNGNMEPDKYKRKKQIFIQNWHGDIAIKKILYDECESTNKKRPIPVTDNIVTDICVAGSDFGEKLYRSAFKYNGEILKIGSPRNDILIKQDQNEIAKIKKILNIDNETKILLYAPTFRDYNIGQSQNIDININDVLENLSQKGEKWICLIRAHSILKGLNIEESNCIINATNYPDIADLLLISDMLITDYSSCAFDFIIQDKPVILTAFDLENYKKNCRSLYFPIEEAGLLVAKNQKELLELINKTSMEDYKKRCIEVKEKFNIVTDGNASEIIAKRINEFYTNNF